MRDRAIGSGVKRRQSSLGEIDITTSDKNPAEAGFFSAGKAGGSAVLESALSNKHTGSPVVICLKNRTLASIR